MDKLLTKLLTSKQRYLLFILILAAVLRFYRLGEIPPSLYWDEASLGYNAYSILQTGRDEHGRLLPLDAFAAFGDQKPPLYVYATVPSIWLFGLNEFAVRLPAALSGLLMVLLTYLVTKQFFSNKTSLLAALLLAISPWSLQMSRGAFEANLAAGLNLLAIYFLWRGIRLGKGWNLFFSAIVFVLTFYTFNSNRLLTPILILGMGLIFFRQWWPLKKWVFVSLIIGFLLLLPLMPHLFSKEGQLRFQEVNIFSDVNIIYNLNERMEVDGWPLWSKILHNRRIAYTLLFLKHYFDNFRLDFLFIDGDVNPRLSIQDVGQLYLVELPLFFAGLYFLMKKKHKMFMPLIFWFLAAPIPAGMARETPHALRILNILPIYQIIIAFGTVSICSFDKKKLSNKILRVINLPIIIFFLYLLNIIYYLHNYYVHYPRLHDGDWMFGYKQVAKYIFSHQQQLADYQKIFVSDVYGRPYIYLLFYGQYPPSLFWQYQSQTYRSEYGIYYVTGFDKYEFGPFDIDKLRQNNRKTLYFVPATARMTEGFVVLDTIQDLRGEEIFVIGEWYGEKRN